MMEHNTDRLFWTITSIIVGALLLTISVKAFPGVANTVTAPLSGLTKQADTSTKTSDQAYKDAINGVNGVNGSSNGSDSSQPNEPDAQAKASAVEADTLNLKVTPNGDGTGILEGLYDKSKTQDLNIPEYVKVNGQMTKITSIDDKAFSYNKLTSVEIPNSVTSIGTSAFEMNQLTSVSLSNSVTNMGDYAFARNKITSVNIPHGVTIIGNSAFSQNNLTSVNIPGSVTSIGDYAFGRNNLTSVNIQNGVTSIGGWAFQYNPLTSVVIPNSITSIGYMSFNLGVNTLSSVNISNQQGYNSAKSNYAFSVSTKITNNPSN